MDTDQRIEQQAGRSIAEIFVEEGEEGFRDRETRIIRQLVVDDNQVVALGGGAVLREENRRILAAEGRTLWLRASVEAIHQRLAGDPSTAASRPDLTSQGGLDEIRQLLDRRTPVYQSCADQTVETDGITPQQVTDRILAALE